MIKKEILINIQFYKDKISQLEDVLSEGKRKGRIDKSGLRQGRLDEFKSELNILVVKLDRINNEVKFLRIN